jgi:hypothetical protein
VRYLANPGETVVTGVKRARGFAYLNLNGGDSWAYFHPEDNPSTSITSRANRCTGRKRSLRNTTKRKSTERVELCRRISTPNFRVVPASCSRHRGGTATWA